MLMDVEGCHDLFAIQNRQDFCFTPPDRKIGDVNLTLPKPAVDLLGTGNNSQDRIRET